jgi:hypothetical protein
MYKKCDSALKLFIIYFIGAEMGLSAPSTGQKMLNRVEIFLKLNGS